MTPGGRTSPGTAPSGKGAMLRIAMYSDTSHNPYYGSCFSKDVCGRAHCGLIGPASLKSKLGRF
jgi:hypothetical protein